MRPGGGADKGSEFERATGRALSLWVSGGQRADLFSRNIMSGGQFTLAQERKLEGHGSPGDLRANHPLAFDFLSAFTIECKHMRSLDFEALLFDQGCDRAFLSKVYAHTYKQARKTFTWPLIVARQNRRSTILLCGPEIGGALHASVGRGLRLRHHILHEGRLHWFDFAGVLSMANPTRFIAAVKAMEIP